MNHTNHTPSAVSCLPLTRQDATAHATGKTFLASIGLELLPLGKYTGRCLQCGRVYTTDCSGALGDTMGVDSDGLHYTASLFCSIKCEGLF